MLHLNSKKEREVIIKEYTQLYSKDILKNLPCYHGDNFPANMYLFKFNNRNTRKRCEPC